MGMSEEQAEVVEKIQEGGVEMLLVSAVAR
jgi:hypothetical protein